MFRKHTAFLLAAAMLTVSAAALAEAPTSQFGFKGWPYRQTPPCQAATPTPAPEQTPIPTQAPSATTPAAPDATATALPPTEEPSIPTKQPTAAPTSTPTIAPTARPAVQPTATPTVRPIPTQTPSMDEDYNTNSLSAQEQIAFNLLNSDRKAYGRAALALDPELCRLARLKSEDMRDNNYFAHESPTYGRVADMLRQFGYAFNGAGENIAHHATVEKSEAAFLSSTGHRQNILSTAWTKVGVGVAFDRNGYVYLTQIFAR